MMNRQFARRILVAAVAGLLFTGAASLHVRAADNCPEDIDLCVFVNSNLDTNIRDDLMTFREALLITNGTLPIADLTPAEAGQVVINVPPGWGPNGEGDAEGPGALTPPGFGGPGGIGSTSVYFDPAVFCAGCSGNNIVLTPPGFGGPGGIGSNSLPLVPALPTVGSDSLDIVSRVGMGYRDGQEIPVVVTIDGSALGAGYAGLTLGAGGSKWVRGLALGGFAGAAVQFDAEDPGAKLLGSNYDGQGDDAEWITYSGNTADVVGGAN